MQAIDAAVILIVAITADVLDVVFTVLDALLGAGEILKWLMNAAVTMLLQTYLWIRGSRGLWLLAGGILEFVPGVNALPMRTATALLTLVMAKKKRGG